MSNPFASHHLPKEPFVPESKVHLICTQCDTECMWSEREQVWVHSNDFSRVTLTGVKQYFADHMPVFEVIETTGEEHV